MRFCSHKWSSNLTAKMSWWRSVFFFFICLTKTTSFTSLTLQYSIHSTLLNIIYSILLKSLKHLHCFYLLIYLFIYLFIYLLCFHAQQTNRQKTKQIPKLTCNINWGYNSYLHSYFTLLFTPLTSYTKLGREFTYIYDRL